MIPTPSTISVIICTYTHERWSYLVEAVQSVQHQQRPPEEIIVVVDHNPELAAQIRVTFPDLIVVENTQMRGANGSRNCGLSVAQGDIIVFFDDDTVAPPEWLTQLLAGYTVPLVVGVGGAIEPRWPDRRPAWFPEEFDWIVGCTYRGVPQSVAPVRNLIACNMSFRRTIFDAVGNFREDIGHVGGLPLGCDETEFCIRVHQQLPSSILLYQPGARVYHQVPVSRTRWRYFCTRAYLLGQSKAFLAQLVGTKDGLSAEQAYTFRTLPTGVVRGVIDTLVRGDISGVRRAFAIIAGLSCTMAGYLKGMCSVYETNQRRIHVGKKGI